MGAITWVHYVGMAMRKPFPEGVVMAQRQPWAAHCGP